MTDKTCLENLHIIFLCLINRISFALLSVFRFRRYAYFTCIQKADMNKNSSSCFNRTNKNSYTYKGNRFIFSHRKPLLHQHGLLSALLNPFFTREAQRSIAITKNTGTCKRILAFLPSYLWSSASRFKSFENKINVHHLPEIR